jgi:type IV secretion system protein VirB10
LGEPIVPAIGAGPGPSQIPPPAAQQARQPSQAEALREAARRSSLIAYGGERDSGSAGVRYSDSGGAANTGRQPSQPSTNLDTLRQASVIGQAQARPLPDRNFLITAGSFIPCVLQSAMDSSQPGYVSCIVPRNIYSDNGRVVLMEKGTKIVGEYQGGLNSGQYRLFVLWTRAVTPRGIAIDVASPATDALGRGGMDGRVDNFFWQRFGTALVALDECEARRRDVDIESFLVWILKIRSVVAEELSTREAEASCACDLERGETVNVWSGHSYSQE